MFPGSRDNTDKTSQGNNHSSKLIKTNLKRNTYFKKNNNLILRDITQIIARINS